MFETLRGHLPTALQPVITCAFVCGWRVQSEVLPLEWRQVDRKGHAVRLDAGTTKNRRARHIDYSDLTRSVFDRYDITREADIREGLGKIAKGTKRGDNVAHANGHATKQTA